MLFQLVSCLATASADDLVAITETHQVKTHWTKLTDVTVPSVAKHEVVFAMKHSNLDELEHELISRSTPGNVKYGKHLSFDEVGSMISTKMPATRTLKWIKAHIPSREIIGSSPRGEYGGCGLYTHRG